MIYLIIIFIVLFFILAWLRLSWVVMFLIAALPAYLVRFNVLGLPSTLLEVMIWAVFLAWFFKNYRFIFESVKLKIGGKLKINNRYPFDWEIVLMLLVALVAAGVAGFSSSSLGIWKAYFFEPALFYIVVFNVMAGAKGREKILWSLAVSALAVSALAIYQKFTGQLIDNPLWAAAVTRRVVSFFGYPNAVGLYLGPIILVMVWWLVSVISTLTPHLDAGEGEKSLKDFFTFKGFLAYARNDKVKTVFISLTIVASVLSIYFAKSKGALLGVAAGLIVFGLLAGKKIRRATIIVMIIAAIGIAAFQPARNLVFQTVTFKTVSGQIRLAGWRDSWNMLKGGRFLTGTGLANFQNAVTPYHTQGIFIKDPNDPDAQRKLVFNEAYRTAHWQPLEIYLYPHNIVLNFWSEIGLAGVLLFIWIIGKYFYLGIRSLSLRGSASDRSNLTNEKFIIIGLICAMVVIVVHGIVDAPYFKNDLAVMFWLFVAMMSMIKLESINN